MPGTSSGVGGLPARGAGGADRFSSRAVAGQFWEKKMRRVRTLAAGVLGLCLVGLFATTAQAQRTFDFVTDNGSGNYSLLPNGTVTINMFLRETLANQSTTSLLVSEDGLFSGVTRVTRTTSPSAPAKITAAARDTTNYDFSSSTSAANITANGGTFADV